MRCRKQGWLSIMLVLMVGCGDCADDQGPDDGRVNPDGVVPVGEDMDLLREMGPRGDLGQPGELGGRDGGRADMGGGEMGESPDMGVDDGGVEVEMGDDLGQEMGAGAVCGDGEVEGQERCDDGVIMSGCASTHDDGEGRCVPMGQCAAEYVLLPDGSCGARELGELVTIVTDNQCRVSVTPMAFTVAPGQILKLSYLHTPGSFCPVEVWGHYNGGFTDLQPGGRWDERYEHCFISAARPNDEYMDISTASDVFRLMIRCQ